MSIVKTLARLTSQPVNCRLSGYLKILLDLGAKHKLKMLKPSSLIRCAYGLTTNPLRPSILLKPSCKLVLTNSVMPAQVPCVRNIGLSAPMCKVLGQTKKMTKAHIQESRARNILIMDLRKRIMQAVRDGNSTDPEANWRLAEVLKKCKEVRMKPETIDNAINYQTKNAGESVILLQSPDGVQVLVVCGSVKSSKCKAKLNRVCQKKKLPFQAVTDDVSLSFQKKGVIVTEFAKKCKLSEDEMTELGMEIEAEDVEATDDKTFKFLFNEKEYGTGEKVLTENKSINIVSSQFEYFPFGRIPVNEEAFKVMDELSQGFDDIDADGVGGFPILGFYHNLQLNE